jgi:hypothetical protein
MCNNRGNKNMYFSHIGQCPLSEVNLIDHDISGVGLIPNFEWQVSYWQNISSNFQEFWLQFGLVVSVHVFLFKELQIWHQA